MKARSAWMLRVGAVGAIAIAVAVGLHAPRGVAETCRYPGDVDAGEEVYDGTCIACHGENGTGMVPGTPDFTKEGGVLSKPHSKLVKHIKKGFDSGGGLAMPPRGGDPGLTDEDLADVHAYLHAAFGCG